jgi:DNA-binding CsgD family transcriptional regulator
MKNLFDPRLILSQILGLQKHVYTEADKEIDLKDDIYINEFSKNDHSVRIIFDHANFKILHVSDNIELVTGHSAQDFYKPNVLFVFKFFTLEHYNFMYVWLKWSLTLHSKLNPSEYDRLVDVKHAICGVKIKHKDGHIMRILFRHYPLTLTESSIPKVAVVTLDDITHLMKSDFYWGRIESGKKGERYFRHFVSTDKQNHYTDILTDREKETVRLLAEGKESKEIGKIVYASSHTVDNHRRSMLNKLGVRDTTGLVQICKMIGII